MTQLPKGLPKLPEKVCLCVCDDYDTKGTWGHRDDAMRAYGLACYRAGLERAAAIAEDFENPLVAPHAQDDKQVAEQMAALLRLYFSGVAAAIRSEKS